MNDQKEYLNINESSREGNREQGQEPVSVLGAETAGVYFTAENNQRTAVMPEEKAFTFSSAELIAALLMYVTAYVYIDCIFFTEGFHGYGQMVFAALFVAVTEILCKGKPRTRESWFWLGGLAVSSFAASFASEFNSFPFGHGVWPYGDIVLFMHLFGVWWALSRNGALLEGRSGHLLPLDAINGFLLFPFRHFFLRLRVMAGGLKQLFVQKENRSARKALWTAGAVAVALIMLVSAVNLLADADLGFARFVEDIRFSLDIFGFEDFGDQIIEFFLSLPVAAYLYGLLAGSNRLEESYFENYRSRINRFLNALKKVPLKAWIAVICAFSVIYLAFFAMQGSYLFGAFIGKLPDGFIPSSYARQGFFELCKVTALNFSLLWLVTRVCETDVKQSRALRIACTVFLAECMLLCVVAMSKLVLYISIFGFTPLRLESSWLVCVLFAACGCWMYSLYSEKRVFDKWMYFSAATLILLILY